MNEKVLKLSALERKLLLIISMVYEQVDTTKLLSIAKRCDMKIKKALIDGKQLDTILKKLKQEKLINYSKAAGVSCPMKSVEGITQAILAQNNRDYVE